MQIYEACGVITSVQANLTEKLGVATLSKRKNDQIKENSFSKFIQGDYTLHL